MRVGIIGGAMKPVTRAHWALIKRASQENDRVLVFVSIADRGGRDDDVVVSGSDMREVWERFLVPHLPPNVTLEFGGSPVRRIYETLGEANESGSVDDFTVYSDPKDISTRFADDKQAKYFGDLLKHGQVRFEGVDRTGEMDVSATQMRQFLKHGMRESFISLLPEGIDAEGVWSTLLLRTFVRET